MGNQKYRSLKTGVKFKKKEYYCALELALELVGTKWKMMMIYHLRNGGLRSSELQKKIRDVSNKMFTQTARTLEKDGLVKRKVYPVVPPKVEYSLTPLGESIVPLIMQIGFWGESLEEKS